MLNLWRNGLTYLGALPFILCGVLHWFHPDLVIGHQSITSFAASYTFMISAFMAGTIWGHAAAKSSPKAHYCLILSVTQALLIWLLYLYTSQELFILCMPVPFVMLLLSDGYLNKLGLVSWSYLKMRIIVTAVVVLSLIIFAITSV